MLNVNAEKRPTISELMKFKFFDKTNWQNVKNREFEPSEIPFRPNPMKYKYLLGNKYDENII